MPPIAAGVFLTSVSNMYSNLLIYHKKTNYIMYSSTIAAIVNLILNFICINIFGYMAAAYTTLVAYIVLAGAQVIFARKVHLEETGNKSVYNDKAVLFMAILTIIAALFGLVLYRYTVLRYTLICIPVGQPTVSRARRMLVKKDVLVLNGQKLVQGMQVHKQLMLKIMSEGIAAHHLLCLFVQLVIDKNQWLIKIERK